MNMNNPNPTIIAMNNEYYDLQYIKAIPIADYLHACGIEPAKRYNGYALYHAPYREDSNASLKVDFRQNLWHDYGTSQGGSIIDLVMKMRGCSAYEAMAHLAEGKATTLAPSSFHREAHTGQRRDEQRPSNTRRILCISEKLPLHLQSYLREIRKIDLAVASPYLRYIRNEVGGREYSAIGFANRVGGYELRDGKTFKGTIAPKDISLIQGNTSETHCLFEGFMDFLSLLTMKGKESISPSIVLNSVSNLPRAIAYLCENGILSVRAFFDNDEAGRQALQGIQSSGIKVEDMSQYYARYKDLNEYHVAQRTELKQVIPPRKRGLRR